MAEPRTAAAASTATTGKTETMSSAPLQSHKPAHASASASSAAPSAVAQQASQGTTETRVKMVTRSSSRRKRLFTKELRAMLFGFGDERPSYQETVDTLDDLVTDYIANLTRLALKRSSKRGVVNFENLRLYLKRDKKKHDRVKELLRLQEEIQEAKRAFKE